ncbi:hypothetical protein B0T14DRAFT_32899 [Immersiella caudata]|uniref:Uncharacterized protein n=1 Tax=Immersiella caudata TaxID=314043 RepID=A0AA40CBA3_9PEZI|nr:hypothetical protein B0T14DRAFT_32899 [Immersiella caudata]
MNSKREPTDSDRSEDWVLVTHEEHRDERHPQYNPDNMSSTQLAAAGAPTAHHGAHHVHDMISDEEDGRLALCRKTVSNGTTDTASTNTITGDVGAAGAAGAVSINPPLTEISLRLHQRVMSQGYSTEISRWIEGTTSFGHCARADQTESSIRSRRSKASTISSLEREPTRPSVPSPHDFFGTGGWC